VKSLKVPDEIQSEIKKFQTQMAINKSAKHDKFTQFSKLVTESFGLFPNALPIQFLIKNGEEMGLDEKFILKMIDELEQNGFLSKKTDARGNDYLKFLSFPIDYGQVHIKGPNRKPLKPTDAEDDIDENSEDDTDECSEEDSDEFSEDGSNDGSEDGSNEGSEADLDESAEADSDENSEIDNEK